MNILFYIFTPIIHLFLYFFSSKTYPISGYIPNNIKNKKNVSKSFLINNHYLFDSITCKNNLSRYKVHHDDINILIKANVINNIHMSYNEITYNVNQSEFKKFKDFILKEQKKFLNTKKNGKSAFVQLEKTNSAFYRHIHNKINYI